MAGSSWSTPPPKRCCSGPRTRCAELRLQSVTDTAAGNDRSARTRRGPRGRCSRREACPRPARHVSRPRVLPQFFPAGRAHGGTAAVGEGGVREVDPHDVARGQQLGRRLEIPAAVVARLQCAAVRRRPRGFRARSADCDRSHGAAEPVHAELRGRSPPAAACSTACGSGGGVTPHRGARARRSGGAGNRMAVGHRGGARGGPDGSGADGTGASQHRQERDRSHR